MKKVIAVALSALIATSLATPVTAAETAKTGNVTGETSVENVVLNVEIPTVLKMALDPIVTYGTSNSALGVSSSQFVTKAFDIVNNTKGADVLAAYYLGISLPNGATLLGMSDVTASNKHLELGASSKVISVGVIASKAAVLGASKTEFDDSKKDSIREFNPTTKDLNFGLKVPALGASGTPKASFSFYGAMNAYADWQDDDVIIDGVYVLQPLSSKTTVTTETNATALLGASSPLPAKPTNVAPDGTAANPFVARPGATLGISHASLVSGKANDFYIKFLGAPAVDTIQFTQFGDPTLIYEAGAGKGYTWDKTTQTVHVTQFWAVANVKPIVVSIGDKSYTLSITVNEPPAAE